MTPVVNKNLSYYMNTYRKISVADSIKSAEDYKQISIAILSSFTIRGFKETLSVKCMENRINPLFYVGGYNQYAQEIIAQNSHLYKFKPDLVIIFIDTMALLGDLYYQPYRISDNDRKSLMQDKLSELQSWIGLLKERTNAKIVIHNFEVPVYSPLGIIENKQDFGLLESVRYLNDQLANLFKGDSRVFVFDYDSFCSSIGKSRIMDYSMYYLGDFKLSFDHVPSLCDRYMGYIRPILSLTKKCIVLDLDNTLWGGVIGEDGLEGIKLGPTPEGRPFMEFQKCLLSLYNRGVILAVNSKNNPADALKAIREHPYMVLREEHFAAMQINWTDKITNMKQIATELNIGIDSLVFIDDDRLNREMIASALPEVLVVDLPEDPTYYVKSLLTLEDFNILQLTDEDRIKGKMYAEQRMRNDLLGSVTDLSEYLEKLRMIVTVEKANDMNIPRIAQLTQKTNQYNMTTRRYQEEDIRDMIDRGYIIAAVKVEDKFGDNGITGVIIVEPGERWRIDSFLLSCRVIGRMVEDVLLSCIVTWAKENNVTTITGEFIPTKKNAPAKNFYRDSGFIFFANDNSTELWSLDVKKGHDMPKFIKVVVR